MCKAIPEPLPVFPSGISGDNCTKDKDCKKSPGFTCQDSICRNPNARFNSTC